MARPASKHTSGPCWCNGAIAGYNQHRRRRIRQGKAGEELEPYCTESALAKSRYDRDLNERRAIARKTGNPVEPKIKFYYCEETDLP